MKNFELTQDSRKADELPLENLAEYLCTHLADFMKYKKLHVKQFSGGASNLTYQLSNGNSSVILRRPPSGTKAASAHDMVREYNVISCVHSHYSLSPTTLLLCEEESIIGEKFFIMEKIEGLGIGKELPVELSNSQQENLCINFVNGLVELHEIDITTNDLSVLGKPEGYVERQLEGWYKRFEKAKTTDVFSSDEIYQWLKNHLPLDSGLQALIHNDYKFDNLIVDPKKPEEIMGVLDWEMTTLGDPLLDLGCTLAYWVDKNDNPSLHAIRMMPTHLDGMMTRQQIFDYYCNRRKIDKVSLAPYYVFGIFRLAVIAQQIYYRFYHGQTDNPKFKTFGQLVNILLTQAKNEIAK
jgi:aminoglycoside phosphotransferase (APT) family kinase protein